MINISEELSNFQPIDIESVEQKIGSIPEDMKNAIELYNKALDEISNNNEDIAIIALKKAISIYPAFYEAMNLMGICYVSIGDEDSARAMFKKVIDMDDNSVRASRYLASLDGNVSPEGVTKSSRRKNQPSGFSTLASWLASGLSPERSKPYFIKYIIGFVAGILAMCLLWIFIPDHSPIIIDVKSALGKSSKEQQVIDQLTKENRDLNNRLTEALQALETAKQTEKNLQDQMEQYIVWADTLRNLQDLAAAGKYKDVVSAVENFEGEPPKKIKDEINNLYNQVKSKAIKQFYDSARNIYNSNAKAQDVEVYKKAADEYRMAIKLIEELNENPAYITEVYYYGGKAIALSQYPSKQEAEAEAVRCFDEVIRIAPGSKLASYARARINQIEAGETIKH